MILKIDEVKISCMKYSYRIVICIVLFFGINIVVSGQNGTNKVNEFSVNPIPFYEQLYKKRIWSRVDLRQKQNRGFFSVDREFTRLIIEAIHNDSITDYYNPEEGPLEVKLTKTEVLARLIKDPGDISGQEDWDFSLPYITDDIVKLDGKGYISLKEDNSDKDPTTNPDWWGPWSPDVTPYDPTIISTLEIMEDVIFDKRRGREYRDIQSVMLIVPGKDSKTGANDFIVTFAFKDLERFFKNNPETAIWYNQYNSAENRNLADAFALRLFYGELYKVENPMDDTILGQYGDGKPKQALIMAEILRMKMLEREHNLWSY